MPSTNPRSNTRRGLAAFAVLGAVCLPAVAQEAARPAPSAIRPELRGAVVNVRPERVTLQKMMRPITITLNDTRLEDVLKFIADFTGADLEPVWTSDKAEGLDKDQLITLNAKDLPALTFLENVLERASTDFGEATWQMNKWGGLEIGPKDRLNKRRRVEMYDINDLLFEIPTFDEAPELDLQSVLQASQGGGGGGGGQSPFRDDQDDEDDADRKSKDEMAQDIIALITGIVETEQWTENGGDAASIRHFQGHLIVNAPDYIHRQMVGYPYWPARNNVKVANGRRYLSLGVDTGHSTVDGFAEREVSAVVGGRIIRSGDPGGGG